MNKKVEILVEGRSDRSNGRLTGRTRTNKIVNFIGSDNLIGRLVDVRIIAANPWAMRGELDDQNLAIETKETEETKETKETEETKAHFSELRTLRSSENQEDVSVV
jgi:hypothetical protein